MSPILSLIGNGNQLNIDQTEYYAAILGESPSKGARSPVLWNAAFDNLNISAKMYPMDIAADKLPSAIKTLRDDNRFIGGAVAVPYKQDLVPLLDHVEFEAEAIGAINCIFRDGEKLVGTNTDGAGALHSLVNAMGEQTLYGTTALVLGVGGAGRAVATYIAGVLKKKGTLILSNRTSESCTDLAEKLAELCRVKIVDFPVSHKILKQTSVLVNCTSIGFETEHTDDKGTFTLQPFTPLAPVKDSIRLSSSNYTKAHFMASALPCIKDNLNSSLEALIHFQGLVFDIVYQPRQTMLLHLATLYGLKTLNGEEMNLEQAVIAFQKATKAKDLSSANSESIRRLMKQ